MGNCMAASVKSHSPSIPTSSSTGPSKTSGSSSTTGQLSSNNTSTTTTTTTSTSTSTSGQSSESASEVFREGRILETPNLRVFTFTELKSATKNFKPEMVLGEGAFGRVYKGWLEEKSGSGSTVIAVKKLNPESWQGYEEWQSEIHFLGRLSHPNLVRLLGYCWEEKDLLLVYEFMSKGSLENHLFRRSLQPLSWSLRLKIAIGAARGVAFLHASEKQVIYRDFKASNILIDSNYNPRLSDFGLARNGPIGSNSHVTTRIVGTSGYAAPEYVTTGHLYVKSDVYGFGVVLLEMLSGQRVVDNNRPSGQQKLVEWAKPYLSDRRKLARLMDPRLEGQYPSRSAFQAAHLSLRCLAEEPKNRPSMKEVVETLEQIEDMKGKSKAFSGKSLNNNAQIPANQQLTARPRRPNSDPDARAGALRGR